MLPKRDNLPRELFLRLTTFDQMWRRKKERAEGDTLSTCATKDIKAIKQAKKEMLEDVKVYVLTALYITLYGFLGHHSKYLGKYMC